MALKLQKPIPTLCWCLPTALICGGPGCGLFLALATTVAVPALILSGIMAWHYPAERPWRVARAGIVVAALLIPTALHWHYRTATRQAADAVVGVLVRFRQQQGHYPNTLAEAGLPEQNKERIRYRLSPSGPFLIYPSSFDAFDKYTYDFNRHL